MSIDTYCVTYTDCIHGSSSAQIVGVLALESHTDQMGLLRVIWGVLTNFGQECSIAGLNNAAKARSKLRSLCWIIIFLALMYFTLIGLIGVVVDYNKHPVITTTDLNNRAAVPFPAVTVCNQNRYEHTLANNFHAGCQKFQIF